MLPMTRRRGLPPFVATRCAARIAAVLVSLSALVLLASCSRQPNAEGGGAGNSAQGVVLLRGNGPEPDSLDPQKARSNESHNVLRDLCEGLTTFAKDASPAPGVARTWTVTTDGKTYTFTLRPEARWSNGDRVVAADFVAGLRRLVDPVTASQYAQIIDTVVNAGDIISGKKAPDSLGVTALDDGTVVIHLVAPTPYLPGLLAHPSTCPVHRPTLAAHANEIARPGVMVSNGAFVLKEWVQGSHVLAERNHYYWNDAATHIDAVQYLHISDENAELTRYRGGGLHVTAVVPRGQFEWIKANIGAQLHLSPQLTTYYYGYNLNRAPFKNNLAIRRALSLVIDRERLAQMVLRVGELPAYGWVPPGVHEYSSQSFDYSGRPMPERLAEARRLYAEAGYSREKPLRFELRFNAGEVHERRRLQRRLHVPAVPEGRFRHQPAALQERGIRQPAHSRLSGGRHGEAPRSAATGRKRHPARPRPDATLLLRQQAPGEARSGRLVRQRDERHLQQGSASQDAFELNSRPTVRRHHPDVAAPRSPGRTLTFVSAAADATLSRSAQNSRYQ
jgi:oligopeptide transport system substrate-binding protein